MLSQAKIESDANASSPVGSAREVFKTFLKLGLTSFGGPVAHLGYFRKELVEKQRWISESQFSQLLAICQFLPGPASSQLGFALGLIRAGWLGALAAFLAFTLPSALLLIGFASALPLLSGTIGIAVIHGLKLVAFAVVADAVWGMSKKLCQDMTRRIIAILATMTLLYVGSAWFQLLVVIFGAMAGIIFCRTSMTETTDYLPVRYSKQFGFILFTIFLALLGVALLVQNPSMLYQIAQSFYRAGALVFGGGHVVLPLLQDTIVSPGLVSSESFLAGYGASQAIPGPMFAFSAYLGAVMPSSEQISLLGATVALVFMFLPGFLLVSSALPMWQAISHSPVASNAIAGINAAVVGVLAAALYNPIFTSDISNVMDFIIGASAIAMLAKWRLSPLLVVVWCLVANIVATLALN